MSTGLQALIVLTRREVVRFLRQPSRIIATVGTALLLWVFAGSGFADSFRMPGAEDGVGYAGFLLPGIITMVVLFSTVFASISLIQDRHAGFLQSVLVSPAPAWAVTGSKVLGGTLISTLQASVLLAGALAVGLRPGIAGFAGVVAAAALVSAAVISLGLAAAWWINSTAGFHGVMNMVLMPMWLLSGALFPAEGASPWLAAAIRLNPLHWSTRALSGSLGITESAEVMAWVVTVAFAAAMFGVAAGVMRVRSGRGSGQANAE